MEAFDGYAPLRNGLRRVAADRDEWAGIPVPIEGHRLVINPKFPNAEVLSTIGAPADDTPADVRKRNEWWSERLRSYVVIWEEGGKLTWGLVPGAHHLNYDLATLDCSAVWGIEQESNAVQLLGTLISHAKMKTYLLTGMFIEKSEASGVFYLFRRLKPTVAIRADGDDTRILCSLCLHPIAFYASSWAGGMCPTDDVVAHLMLMRADEPLFWRRANQHAPTRPEAGL